MPYSANWTTVEIRGKYLLSDGTPAAGNITFTPSATRMQDAADVTTIVGSEIVVTLDANGEFARRIPATNDPNITPLDFTYLVKEEIVGGGGSTFSISVPEAADPAGIEMVDIMPVSAANPGSANYIRGVAGGVAALDANGDVVNAQGDKIIGTEALLAAKADLVSGKVPTSQIPAVSINETITVADQDARFALTTDDAQLGDVIIQLNNGERYLVTDSQDLGTEGGYTRMTPGDGVDSVNSYSGDVVLSHTDVGAAPLAHQHEAGAVVVSERRVEDAPDAYINGDTVFRVAGTPVGGNWPGTSQNGVVLTSMSSHRGSQMFINDLGEKWHRSTVGGFSVANTHTDLTAAGYKRISQMGMSIPAGTTVYVSVRFKNKPGCTPIKSDYSSCIFRDDNTGTNYETAYPPTITLSGPDDDGWITAAVTHTVPATRTLTRVYLNASPAVGYFVVGDVVYFDGLAVIDGNLGPYAYFDGDTPNKTPYTYTWTGTAGNSKSRRTETFPTVTNLVVNPSGETNNTGWNGGPLLRVTDKVLYGTRSFLLPAGGSAYPEVLALPGNTTYTASGYVWVPSQITGNITPRAGSTAVVAHNGPTITARDQWTRVSMTFTTDSDGGTLAFYPALGGSTTVTTVTNYMENPRAEAAVGFTPNSQSVWTRTWDTSVFHSGTRSARCEVIQLNGPPALSLYAVGGQAVRSPIAPSLTYTYSAYLRAGQAGYRGRVLLRFYNSSDAQVGTSSYSAWSDTPVGSWVRCSVTATAPADATQVLVSAYIETIDGSMAPVGAHGWADSCSLTNTSTAVGYFDGSTPTGFNATNGQYEEFAWTGAANASTSTNTSSVRVFADGLMVTAGNTLHDYFDGSTTNTATDTHAWTGTAHNSTSTRNRIAIVENHILNPNSAYGVTGWATNTGGQTATQSAVEAWTGHKWTAWTQTASKSALDTHTANTSNPHGTTTQQVNVITPKLHADGATTYPRGVSVFANKAGDNFSASAPGSSDQGTVTTWVDAETTTGFIRATQWWVAVSSNDIYYRIWSSNVWSSWFQLALKSSLDSHTANVSNPHAVTSAQVTQIAQVSSTALPSSYPLGLSMFHVENDPVGPAWGDGISQWGTVLTERGSASRCTQTWTNTSGLQFYRIYASGWREWNRVLTPTTPVSTKTISYTLVLFDAGTQIDFNSASAVNLTVPTNASVAFPVGTTIDFGQAGAGQVTVAPASGVTLHSRGARLKTNGQYAQGTIRKTATDTWRVYGDLVV